MSARIPAVSSRRHSAKKIVWLAAALVLAVITVARALSCLPERFADPARLGGIIHVTTANGFTLRWVELRSDSNATTDIVFTHGSPGGAGVWAAQFQKPFPAANLFAYDRPGFGASLPRLREPHLQTQADALMALLALTGTNRVFLVGHSYGSPVVLLATLEHPEKISGALLIGGDVDPALEKPWLIQYALHWRLTSWLLPRPLRQCNREMLTVRDDLEAMQKKIPGLAVPVVMLHGDRDPLVPVANVAWMEAQLKAGGRTNLFARIILPGVNHFIPWEHPDEVGKALGLLEKMAADPSTHQRVK